MSIEVKITAETPDITDIKDGYADFTTTLVLDDGVGSATVEIECWLRCGWLPPGSHQNLDGSGLANWGDSQPGGWECLESDGQGKGIPDVIRDDECQEIRLDTISSGARIHPFGAWKAALDVAESDDAFERLEDIYYSICDAIEAAIEQHSWPHVDEPSAEQVFDELKTVELDVEIDNAEIRAGNWRGCGMVLVLEHDGEYIMTYWPSEADIASVLDEIEFARIALANARADIMKALDEGYY